MADWHQIGVVDGVVEDSESLRLAVRPLAEVLVAVGGGVRAVTFKQVESEIRRDAFLTHTQIEMLVCQGDVRVLVCERKSKRS